MSRGRHSSWHIAKIFNNITWDAGIVVRSAFRGLHKPRKTKPKQTEYVRFVYKGQYYRRPIAPRTREKTPPELLKLPPAGPQVVPQLFKTPPNPTAQKAEALVASKPTVGNGSQHTWSWRSWWKLNTPLLVINFGSLCTLLGFTRSDVLELRSLAITGNICFVIYSLLQPPPIRWAACCWSALFASVNGFKIARIIHEREGKTYLSPHEEDIYHEHFLSHGVSPKQFEMIMSTGKTVILKKGDILSRQGEQVSSVKLVVRGNTRANVMGRHLTAIGSVKGNRVSLQGGDSGAWVGEMAFLQSLWDRDHAKKSTKKRTSEKISGSSHGEIVSARGSAEPRDEQFKYCAISTVVATEDVQLIEWSFKDMQKVMKSSRDIQDSMTRAMTAAIVGKVVNFMVSRQSAVPTWSTMLDNWKHSSPRHKQGGETRQSEEEEEEEEEVVVEEEANRSAQALPQATSP